MRTTVEHLKYESAELCLRQYRTGKLGRPRSINGFSQRRKMKKVESLGRRFDIRREGLKAPGEAP